MASDQSFVEYLVGQIENAGALRYRKMFGEYAIYCDEKVVILVCDNQAFVKPTEPGRAFIGDPTEEPPYPGAKNHFLLGAAIEDGEWLGDLVRLTAAALPKPKPKKPRRARARSARG